MEPQDYSKRIAYRPPSAFYRRLNRLAAWVTSFGLAPIGAVTLEVRGRASGKVRRVPVLVTGHGGKDHLVALAGESQWVRNVRAAGGFAVLRRLRSRRVRLEELPVGERAEIIAEYLQAARGRSGSGAGARQARSYFGLGPNPSARDLRAIAEFYPVFTVTYLDD